MWSAAFAATKYRPCFLAESNLALFPSSGGDYGAADRGYSGLSRTYLLYAGDQIHRCARARRTRGVQRQARQLARRARRAASETDVSGAVRSRGIRESRAVA